MIFHTGAIQTSLHLRQKFLGKQLQILEFSLQKQLLMA